MSGALSLEKNNFSVLNLPVTNQSQLTEKWPTSKGLINQFLLKIPVYCESKSFYPSEPAQSITKQVHSPPTPTGGSQEHQNCFTNQVHKCNFFYFLSHKSVTRLDF
ncbi:hypothetical protein GOODEAATRI_001694 [Goodea atripinnis]|uniref:Uncharacterized protein n=1 Tax=Goodea atripinnis TaxID=208336 RepID=A0ABV0NR11_9TELE